MSLFENGNAVAPQVQCCKYDTGARLEWPYFDYLENTNVIAEPESDFRFIEFQEKLLAEYAADHPPLASTAA